MTMIMTKEQQATGNSKHQTGRRYCTAHRLSCSKEPEGEDHHIRTKQLITKLKNGRLLYGATALDESATSSAEQPTIDGSHSSDGKSTKNLETDKKYFKDSKDYADKYDEDYAKWDLEKPLECTIELVAITLKNILIAERLGF